MSDVTTGNVGGGPCHLEVVHISDVHFGRHHRFRPDPDSSGEVPRDESFPSLFQKISEDLVSFFSNERYHYSGKVRRPHIVVCITGDLTQIADPTEFEQAKDLVTSLANLEILGAAIGIQNIFCVPGNHDLKYDEPQVAQRWTEFAEFHNALFETKYRREKPEAFMRLEFRGKDDEFAFLLLNSAAFVLKNDIEATRGRLSVYQLAEIDRILSGISQARLARAIKIAMIHHHPVLLPELVEAGSNYDAIYGSGPLLTKLRSYGFHAILHGHKHLPVIFTDDSRYAFSSVEHIPMVLISGGSVGSKELPSGRRSFNTYNIISMTWDSLSEQYRLRTECRALDIYDNFGQREIPAKWSWFSLLVDERVHFGLSRRPIDGAGINLAPNDPKLSTLEEARVAEYQRTKGWFPVVDVMPSLLTGVHYEARVWLVHHDSRFSPRSRPRRVIWQAGDKFPCHLIEADPNDCFCATFLYYGPMLIQCHLEFDGGVFESCFVYARRPANYLTNGNPL